MSSQTDIVNRALLRIGQKTISDINEDSVTATKCKAIWDEVLDEVLAAGPEKGWKFAKPEEESAISVDATSPGDGYEYRYKLPNDFIRAIRVHVAGTDITDWQRKGQYIVTNEESEEIELEYVRRIILTGLFPPHFTRVLALWLAYELCFNIVQSKNHANAVYQELYGKVLPQAIALDEQDKYVQEESSSWVDIGRTRTTFE